MGKCLFDISAEMNGIVTELSRIAHEHSVSIRFSVGVQAYTRRRKQIAGEMIVMIGYDNNEPSYITYILMHACNKTWIKRVVIDVNKGVVEVYLPNSGSHKYVAIKNIDIIKNFIKEVARMVLWSS